MRHSLINAPGVAAGGGSDQEKRGRTGGKGSISPGPPGRLGPPATDSSGAAHTASSASCGQSRRGRGHGQNIRAAQPPERERGGGRQRQGPRLRHPASARPDQSAGLRPGSPGSMDTSRREPMTGGSPISSRSMDRSPTGPATPSSRASSVPATMDGRRNRATSRVNSPSAREKNLSRPISFRERATAGR